MRDPLTWLIIFAVYAPFHYLGPVLVTLLTGTEDTAGRRRLFRSVLIDCTISLGLALAIAIWLVEKHLMEAMLVLFVATLAPYTYIWLHRRRRGTSWFTSHED
jgi:hypothetical protein